MPVDKSWITHPSRNSPEYRQGVDSFIKMCEAQVDINGRVRCACTRCHNNLIIPFDLMKYHMRVNGFCRSYKKWTFHGESSIPPVVDNVMPRGDMDDVIEDIRDELMEEDADLDEGNSDTESSGGSDEFEELLKEAGSELYPGCKKFTSLDWLAKVMHIKVTNKLTNSALDQILALMRESHPEGNKIPRSHYEAKKY